MPIIIFGGVLTGISTATAAAVWAVAYGLMSSMAVCREIDLRKPAGILGEIAIVTGKIVIMVEMASAFAWIMRRKLVPQVNAGLFFGPQGS